MERTIVPLLFMLLFLSSSAQSGRAQSFDIVKLADGVYAAIRCRGH